MSFQIQNQIRHNAADIREYISDLYAWEDEVNVKEPKQSKEKEVKQPVPVRGTIENSDKQSNSKETNQTDEANPEIQKLRRDVNSIPDYYKAWDKFDADQELEKVDSSDSTIPSSKPPKKNQDDNPMKPTSGAPPSTKMVVKGGRGVYNDVNSLKEKGNLYFRSLEYDKALLTYTECLEKTKSESVTDEVKVSLFSNRAMTYLKLNEWLKAEGDCNSALEIDPSHVKSLTRRAKARRKLNKLKESLEDLNAAGKVEPTNKEILEDIRLLKSKMNAIKEEQMKKMVLIAPPADRRNFVKIQVVDYDPDKLSNDQKKSQNPVENHASNSKKSQEGNPNLHVESTKAVTEQKVPKELNILKKKETDTAVPQTTEEGADFLNLKEIEGKIIHHSDNSENVSSKLAENIDSNHLVYFRMDLNEEKDISEIVPKPIEHKKKNIKPILKHKSTVKKSASAHITNEGETENKNAVEKTIKIFENVVIKEAVKVEKREEQKLIETSSEFLSTWKHIKNNAEACEKFLVTLVKPQRIPQIFKEGMEIDLFLELLTFMKKDIDRNLELCANIMSVLPKIKRFDIVMKSLISKEKKDVREVLSRCLEANVLNQDQLDTINKFSSTV